MTPIKWYSPKIIRKAMPALVVIFFIFISILILMEYTDAFFLVIILWITLPVFAVKAYRRLRDLLHRRRE